MDQAHVPPAESEKRPTVLVVDDEPSIRDFLAFILEDEGFRVETASDGFEALAVARRSAPDLVLTDLMMPVVDGYRLIAGLRREHVPAPVIVAMSAVPPQDQDQPHADTFLAKPFDVSSVIETVQTLLKV